MSKNYQQMIISIFGAMIIITGLFYLHPALGIIGVGYLVAIQEL